VVTRTRPGTRLVQKYPYEIICTSCDARLIAIDMDWVVLLGPRPIEIIGSLEGEAHIACHKCGELVAVDRDLLLLN